MTASLPMYDWPEVRPATDALWAALRVAFRRRGIAAVATLQRDQPRDDTWCDPGLLFSQTCGYPYVTELRDTVRLVATPVYVAEGSDGPTYRSAIVVRADDPVRGLHDLQNSRAAFNSRGSQSGYSAFRAAIAPLAEKGRFFSETLEAGSHLQSMAAVAEGRADCAAIDCVCWSMAEHYRSDLASRLRVLAWSPPAPALPFVTSASRSDDERRALRDALFEVLSDPETAAARRSLLLAGAEIVDDKAYDAITDMERDAVAAGYHELA